MKDEVVGVGHAELDLNSRTMKDEVVGVVSRTAL
jgi:hypothetical protein